MPGKHAHQSQYRCHLLGNTYTKHHHPNQYAFGLPSQQSDKRPYIQHIFLKLALLYDKQIYSYLFLQNQSTIKNMFNHTV